MTSFLDDGIGHSLATATALTTDMGKVDTLAEPGVHHGAGRRAERSRDRQLHEGLLRLRDRWFGADAQAQRGRSADRSGRGRDLRRLLEYPRLLGQKAFHRLARVQHAILHFLGISRGGPLLCGDHEFRRLHLEPRIERAVLHNGVVLPERLRQLPGGSGAGRLRRLRLGRIGAAPPSPQVAR